jgi:GT2 family glycosyltransferase
MKILAVIPTLAKDIKRLNETIRSLRKNSDTHQFEILVVNNSELPDIKGLVPVEHLYSPGVNLGYVGALEFARRSHQSDYVWVIQDDMTLDNDVLAVLVNSMLKSPRLAVASPVLVRGGVIPARTRAGVFTNPQQTQWENYPPVDTPPEDLPLDVDYSFVSGSGALFRSKALSEINGFNLDLYPLMHVDVDVCARLLDKGWKISLEPDAHINHQVNGSTPKQLAVTLEKRNRVVVEQYLANRETQVDLTRFDPLDTDLLFYIARRASFLFLEVSRAAQSQLEESESQLRAAQSQLEENAFQLRVILNSTSWRVTTPIRAFGRRFKARGRE